MKNSDNRNFRPKACLHCGGDAYFSRDDLDWVCLQCGRIVLEPQGVVQFELKAQGNLVPAGVARGREAA